MKTGYSTIITTHLEILGTRLIIVKHKSHQLSQPMSLKRSRSRDSTLKTLRKRLILSKMNKFGRKHLITIELYYILFFFLYD